MQRNGSCLGRVSVAPDPFKLRGVPPADVPNTRWYYASSPGRVGSKRDLPAVRWMCIVRNLGQDGVNAKGGERPDICAARAAGHSKEAAIRRRFNLSYVNARAAGSLEPMSDVRSRRSECRRGKSSRGIASSRVCGVAAVQYPLAPTLGLLRGRQDRLCGSLLAFALMEPRRPSERRNRPEERGCLDLKAAGHMQHQFKGDARLGIIINATSPLRAANCVNLWDAAVVCA